MNAQSEEKFTFTETTNKEFDIKLNFGNIIEIQKDTKNKFDKFLKEYESEIDKLNSVVDINKIISDPKYNSKIIYKLIKRIFTFEEFKLYFKLDKKYKNIKGPKINENIKLEIEDINNIHSEKEKQQDKMDKNILEIIKNMAVVDNNKKESVKNEESDEIKTDINNKSIEENKIRENINLKQIGIINNEFNNEPSNSMNSNNNTIKNETKSRFTLSLNLNSINTPDSSIYQSNLGDDDKESNIEDNKEISKYNFLAKRLMEELQGDNEDILEGKDYETKVKRDFKIIFDICSDETLKIESNPNFSLRFIYQAYEKLLAKGEYKRDNKITGNEKNCSVGKFDILIKNVTKKAISNLITDLRGNIIAESNLEKLDDKKKYQIIGEVAKDILSQSKDKIKQISKYIDIILINNKLKQISHKITNLETVLKGFETINLNFNDDKIFMIISDGSFIKLSKAHNIKEDEIKSNNNPNEREKMNIKYFKKIVNLLNDSGIPYIIFYLPSEIKNQLDDFLVEYMKSKKDKYKAISDNEIKIQKNFIMSYYIKSFLRKIKEFKTKIFTDIIKLYYNYDLDQICKQLFNKIINKFQAKNEIVFELLIFNLIDKKTNIDAIELFLSHYNFLKIEKKIIKEEDLNNIKDKKIYENNYRILLYEDNRINFRIDNEKYFSAMINNKDFNDDNNEFKKKFGEKIKKYFSSKLENNVKKNFIYYSNNNEYMNKKNLINKIIYDLKTLNYTISYNKIEKDEFNSEQFNFILNSLKSENIMNNIQLLFQEHFDDNDKKILNLNAGHFEYINKYKDDVLEEFLCWEIYRTFFCDYLVRKICEC